MILLAVEIMVGFQLWFNLTGENSPLDVLLKNAV
jgi:hypothetical protein